MPTEMSVGATLLHATLNMTLNHADLGSHKYIYLSKIFLSLILNMHWMKSILANMSSKTTHATLADVDDTLIF